MFCRFCGTNLPDDSTFCQYCGKSLTSNQSSSSGAAAAPALAPPEPAKNTGVRTGLLVALLAVLGFVLWAISNHQIGRPSQTTPTTFSVTPQPRVMPLVDTAFTLNAAQGMHWNFTVPPNATDVRVEGTFTASGGTGNDVEVYLLNDDEFVNWQNRHAVNTLYNSGRMTQGTVNAVLPPGPGAYHLVFNNKFSLISPKAVRASIRLHYSL